MADYQRVVEFLRDVRLQANKQVTEDVRRYAAEFADLCKLANDRLRQCSTFLGQGLRTEAIHLAEEPPNLLDLVAALDLPDPEEWAEFCRQSDLPIPQALQMDRAAQLNDAYAQDQPLEHLLNRHRLLALSRGPVRERLDVMRQIAAQDTGTLWEKSIRTFEKARLRELPAEFLAAVKQKDGAGITALNDEVHQNWMEPVPDDLLGGVTEAYNRLRRVSVEASLRELVKPLRDAFAAKSYGESVALVQKWREIISQNDASVISADLNDEIQPVVEWLKDEDDQRAKHKEFVNACRNFTNLLDADGPAAELEALHEKIKQFDEEIPEAIETRYQELLKRRAAAIGRQHRLRLTMVGAAVVLVLVVIGAAYMVMQRANAAREWTRQITDAIAIHDLAHVRHAKDLVADQEKRDPSLDTDPKLADAKKQVEQLNLQADADLKDVTAFASQLDTTRAVAEPALPSDKQDVLLTALAKSTDTLAQTGRDLAWVDADEKLATARRQLQAVHDQLLDKVSQQVKNNVAALSQQLDDLASKDNDAEVQTGLHDIASKLRAILELPALESDTKTAISALLDRDTQMQTVIDKRLAENDALHDIRVHATSADELKKALQNFVAHFADSPRTADFTNALIRTPFDKSVEAWLVVAQTWNNKFVPTTTAIAQKRIDDITKYTTLYPGSPFVGPATTYIDYNKAASDALGETGTWQKAYDAMLTNPLMNHLSYVQDSTGRRYYIMGNMNRHETHLNNETTTMFTALNPKALTTPQSITIVPPVTLPPADPTPFPHTDFVKNMAEEIKAVDENNWETYGIDVVDRLSKADDWDTTAPFETVIRAILIEKAIKTTVAVDGWAIGDVYDKAITDFARQNPSTIKFYDPDKPVPAATLESLKRIIAALPKAAAVKNLLAQNKAGLFGSLGGNFAGTGVLLRDDKGNWTAQPSSQTDGTIVLAIAIPPIPVEAAPATQAAPTTAPAAPADSQAAPDATAPASAPAATGPASDDAAAAAAAAAAAGGPAPAAPPAPPPPPPTLTPNVPTNWIRIAELKGDKFVVDEKAVQGLPQGTLIYFSKP